MLELYPNRVNPGWALWSSGTRGQALNPEVEVANERRTARRKRRSLISVALDAINQRRTGSAPRDPAFARLLGPLCGDQSRSCDRNPRRVGPLRRGTAGYLRRRIWCHPRWLTSVVCDSRCSQRRPESDVARRYGVYRAHDGTTERALFTTMRGIVRSSFFSPVGINPGADGILRALESLTEVDQCAAMMTERCCRCRGGARSARAERATAWRWWSWATTKRVRMRAYHPTVKEIAEAHGCAFAMVIGDFPLPGWHPPAQHPAEPPRLPVPRGDCWEMHDHMVEHQRALE